MKMLRNLAYVSSPTNGVCVLSSRMVLPRGTIELVSRNITLSKIAEYTVSHEIDDEPSFAW